MEKYKELTITSPFGERLNPLNGQKEHHNGLDFRPPTLREAFAGFSSVYYRDGYGNKAGIFLQLRTKINHVRFYINLMHLESIQSWVKSSSRILRPDDIVAEMGTTGASTGIHLHYEIFTYFIDAEFIDELKDNINYHISSERRPRIYFEPIELYDYCVKNNIYI